MANLLPNDHTQATHLPADCYNLLILQLLPAADTLLCFPGLYEIALLGESLTLHRFARDKGGDLELQLVASLDLPEFAEQRPKLAGGPSLDRSADGVTFAVGEAPWLRDIATDGQPCRIAREAASKLCPYSGPWLAHRSLN